MSTSTTRVNSPAPPKLDLSGVHSQLFQTPSATSASSSLYQTISSSTRKRHRSDDDEKPRVAYNHLSVDDGDDDGLYRSSWLGRHANLDIAETDYDNPEFCGQLPLTPPIEASVNSLMGSSISGNARKRSRHESWFSSVELKPDDEEITDQADNSISSPRPASWGQSVINVVERVWNFCWSGAFRGFYAGGGHGYHMPADSIPQLDDTALSRAQSQAVEKTTPAATSPIPGQYPDESWVVVPTTDGPPDRNSFGAEASSSPMPAKQAQRLTGPPGLSHNRARSSGVPRVGKISLSGQSTPTRIPILSPNSKMVRETPVSAETQRYVARMRRLEREEDASMRRFNRQLQMMIKEGQQALGTQVEVGDMDMDS